MAGCKGIFIYVPKKVVSVEGNASVRMQCALHGGSALNSTRNGPDKLQRATAGKAYLAYVLQDK